MVFSPVGVWTRLKPHLSWRNGVIAGVSIVGVLILTVAGSFFWPRTVHFAYSAPNCFTNPTLLPGLTAVKQSASYQLTASGVIRVGNVVIYANSSCITPIQMPKVGDAETIRVEAVGSTMLAQSIRIEPQKLPLLTPKTALDQPIGTTSPIGFSLSETDLVFDYELRGNGLVAACSEDHQVLTCDPSSLGLKQSAKYDISLVRRFHGSGDEVVLHATISTVEAVSVTGSSVAAGQTIYDVPTDLVLTLNRPTVSSSGVSLRPSGGDSKSDLPITSSLSGTQLTIHFTTPLPRSSSLVLNIDNLTAADGGKLTSAYSLPFKVSGGPKVTNINIGTSKVSTSGSIVLSFDARLLATQTLSDFIHFGPGEVKISAKGNVVTITPSAALPKCSYFSVQVLDGLKNEAGIAGGSAWTYKFRTICQTVYSVGTSVQGRSITAYRFGNGPSKIVFVGDMHGNERSATYLLNSLVDALETGYDKIPANRTIIVIPTINPDGFAANRRTNANNVDLNRNFPSNDWKAAITEPDHTFLPTGGGTAPLSEPESQAIANVIANEQPRLVLTYHATGGIVLPNEAGDSVALASLYDQKSTVSFLAAGNSSSFFDYDITGTFEGWLYDKINIATLLIELYSNTANEFSGNQNALWAMVQLP